MNMNKRLIQSLVLTGFLLVIIFAAKKGHDKYVEENIRKFKDSGYYGKTPFIGAFDLADCFVALPNTSINEVEVVAEEVPEEEEPPVIEQTWLFDLYSDMGYSRETFYGDLRLLAAITTAEAGNQSELGKRLVIDTVLNRIWSHNFGWRDDWTIYETVSHPGQYDTWTNGAYKRVAIDEDMMRLIEEELLNQTNSQVIYFKTNGYFSWAPKLFKEGDHYFSGDCNYE